MKKTVLAVLVAVMAMSSGITAFAYWKSELKVKANIPVVYDVDIEVLGDVKGQGKVEKVDIPDQGDITIRPDQDKKSSSESVQEESTANTEEQTTKESIQNKPSIEETKESITKTENNTESKAEADTNNEEIKR